MRRSSPLRTLPVSMSFWTPKLELPKKAFGYLDILRVEYEYEEEGTLYELAAKAPPASLK